MIITEVIIFAPAITWLLPLAALVVFLKWDAGYLCDEKKKRIKKKLDLIMQRCESSEHLGPLWRPDLHLFLRQTGVCSVCWRKVGHRKLSWIPHESCWQRQTHRWKQKLTSLGKQTGCAELYTGTVMSKRLIQMKMAHQTGLGYILQLRRQATILNSCHLTVMLKSDPVIQWSASLWHCEHVFEVYPVVY